jgi:hypothetical protein
LIESLKLVVKPQDLNMYINIIDGVQALLTGNIKEIKYDFFMFIKVNPNDIQNILIVLNQFNEVMEKAE